MCSSTQIIIPEGRRDFNKYMQSKMHERTCTTAHANEMHKERAQSKRRERPCFPCTRAQGKMNERTQLAQANLRKKAHVRHVSRLNIVFPGGGAGPNPLCENDALCVDAHDRRSKSPFRGSAWSTRARMLAPP